MIPVLQVISSLMMNQYCQLWVCTIFQVNKNVEYGNGMNSKWFSLADTSLAQ